MTMNGTRLYSLLKDSLSQIWFKMQQKPITAICQSFTQKREEKMLKIKLRIGVTILISGKKYRVQGRCSYWDKGSYFTLIKGKIHKNAMTLIYLTQWFSTRWYKTSKRSYLRLWEVFLKLTTTLIFRECWVIPFLHDPESLLIGIYCILQILGP